MHRAIRLGIMTLGFLGCAAWIIYYQFRNSLHIRDTMDPLDGIGGPFDLIDQDGKQCKSDDFKGKYLLVYFGYSYCPDVCPMALQHISEGLKGIKKDRDQIVPIFITLDPERDSISQLKIYSENYDPNIRFLTGPKEEIKKNVDTYKAYSKKINSPQTTEYLVDHSTLIYLLDRKGKIITFFPHTIAPSKLTDLLTRVLAKEYVNQK